MRENQAHQERNDSIRWHAFFLGSVNASQNPVYLEAFEKNIEPCLDSLVISEDFWHNSHSRFSPFWNVLC
jgi:hypothetical protein